MYIYIKISVISDCLAGTTAYDSLAYKLISAHLVWVPASSQESGKPQRLAPTIRQLDHTHSSSSVYLFTVRPSRSIILATHHTIHSGILCMSPTSLSPHKLILASLYYTSLEGLTGMTILNELHARSLPLPASGQTLLMHPHLLKLCNGIDSPCP